MYIIVSGAEVGGPRLFELVCSWQALGFKLKVTTRNILSSRVIWSKFPVQRLIRNPGEKCYKVTTVCSQATMIKVASLPAKGRMNQCSLFGIMSPHMVRPTNYSPGVLSCNSLASASTYVVVYIVNKYRHKRARELKINSDNAKRNLSKKLKWDFEFKIILFHPITITRNKKQKSFERERTQKKNQINVKTTIWLYFFSNGDRRVSILGDK